MATIVCSYSLSYGNCKTGVRRRDHMTKLAANVEIMHPDFELVLQILETEVLDAYAKKQTQ